MDSMVEVLRDHSIRQPNKIWAVDERCEVVSYEDAWKRVQELGQSLKYRYGIKKNDRIMVECNQKTDFLLVDFACEIINAVFVPIEKGLSPERKKGILNDTESVLFVYAEEAIDGIRSITYEELFENVLLDELMCDVMPLAESMAEILYTTGTTGKSKGISISNIANVALAENIMLGVEMKHNNVEIIPLSLSHSHGLRCCYANLLNGSTVVITDGLSNINKVFEMIKTYDVNAMDISPNAAMLLIRLARNNFWKIARDFDYIQIGTANLSENIKEELVNGLPRTRLYNFYGSTEAGRSCVLDFNKYQGKNNCIGRPTKNSEIIFVDNDRNIIDSSEECLGQLATKGQMNMIGYWKNDELTKDIFDGTYVYSADIGYMDAEGFIYVLGRVGDVINYNGIKISPSEIEDVAIRYKGISDVACVPYHDEILGQIPKLFICITGDFDMSEYISFLNNHLDKNKIPKRIEIIDEIPRTYNGKIIRRELTKRV